MRALHDRMACVRDLVVVDYLMPEVDGLETIASLTSEMRQTSQVSNYRPAVLASPALPSEPRASPLAIQSLLSQVCLLSGEALREQAEETLHTLGLKARTFRKTPHVSRDILLAFGRCLAAFSPPTIQLAPNLVTISCSD